MFCSGRESAEKERERSKEKRRIKMLMIPGRSRFSPQFLCFLVDQRARECANRGECRGAEKSRAGFVGESCGSCECISTPLSCSLTAVVRNVWLIFDLWILAFVHFYQTRPPNDSSRITRFDPDFVTRVREIERAIDGRKVAEFESSPPPLLLLFSLPLFSFLPPRFYRQCNTIDWFDTVFTVS